MGTGYTRADVSNNIADGNIINSADLDNEYDAIEAAFNSSTGHTHDGTAAEGGAITVVGPVQDLVVSATEVKPKTTNTLDLGTSALLYKDAYLQGNMYFRDTALKIVSSADGQLDIDADVELELVAPTVDIDASTAVTIDTASTTFTSTLFNVTGSANITGDLDVDNINIDGNTIISTDTNGAINITPNGTGAVNITATTNITGDLDVDNININGNTIISTDTNGNIALTPNGTGEVDISKVDIDSGAIDGTVIGANSAAAITGTTITGTSFVTSGDMTFGDNDKAIFGDSNDLQIYHTGADSLIAESGTGRLKIQSNGLGVDLSSTTGELMLRARTDNAVELYYDQGTYSDPKLSTTATGVDVTGTVTADAATLSGTSPVLSYSDTDNSITAQIGSGTSDFNIATTSAHNLDIRTNNTRRMVVESDGDISFYDSTGVTQGFFWDASAQKLGLGTTTPSTVLHVKGADTVEGDAKGQILIRDTAAYNANPTMGILFQGEHTSGSQAYMASIFGAKENATDGNYSGYLAFATRSQGSTTAERMRIDSSGNVGIGTTSPSTALDVTGTSRYTFNVGNAYTVQTSLNSAGSAFSDDYKNASQHIWQTSGSEAVRIDSSGKVGIGTSSPAQLLHVEGGTDTRIRTEESGGSFVDLTVTNAGHFIDSTSTGDLTVNKIGSANMIFKTANAERMRIDSVGNVGIGTSSPDTTMHIHTGSAGTVDAVSGGVLTLEKNDHAVLQFLTPNNKKGIVYFGDPDDIDAGRLEYDHSLDAMLFNVNASERMRIDSSGNLLVGGTTGTAGGKITVTTANAGYVAIEPTSNVTNQIATGIRLHGNINETDRYVGIFCYNEAANNVNAMTFWTTNSGASSERMRITSGGNVGIGTSSPSTKLDVSGGFNATASIQSLGVYNNTTGTGANLVVDSGGGFARSTSSLRYKNTVNDATHGLTELLALRPVTYKGNNDGDTVFGGLIAEEVHDAGLTEFVTYNEDGEPDALAYGNMVSLCIKAIQEQQATITALEARIAALEAN